MVGASRGLEASEGEVDGVEADGGEVEDDMMDAWGEISENGKRARKLQEVLMWKTASAESIYWAS
jgi:hypothetical protein